ncbi:MAG TPA: hypothetical protein VFX82_13080 [Desulfobacterales bacterium]|nr:hypothetical protein [Desulfobacterales bacterium]
MQQVFVGLSLHRPEMIPLISAAMRCSEAIFLEEPPAPGFDQMIRGELSVEEYLLPIDVEYPAFSRDMCSLLRELHAEGKKILQVEPFIESLLHIHEFFAEGHKPDEVSENSIEFYVYRAERAATGALLAYYQTVGTGTFEETLDAIIRFARADAARFRLRDSLRAQALVSLVRQYPSSYIESGLIHYQLWRLLRDRLRPHVQVQPLFLADAALRSMGEKGHLYGPGDQLTLLYIFHPTISQPEWEKLLAARSMIYSKILEKQESDGVGETFPHLRDELACIRAVRQLSIDDCGHLFPLIRRASSSEARQRVAALGAVSELSARD